VSPLPSGPVSTQTGVQGVGFYQQIPPLKDIIFIENFIMSPEIHTIIWPNGADFAPQFFYENIRIMV